MRERIGRKMGATSVVALMVLAATALGGISIAVAATFVPSVIKSVNTSAWSPPSGEPSGVTLLPGGRLLVVDTNFNEANNNGWVYTLATGQVTNRATGVDEPTGVDHDPESNTLFITSDNRAGAFIEVIRNFDTPQETRTTIDTEALNSEDTEDPAYDEFNDILYFVDGETSTLFKIVPVDGIFGNPGDVITSYSIAHLSSEQDWEGLAWDPVSGNLLLGNRLDRKIYEINKANGTLINTIDASGIDAMTYISGLGTAPSTLDSTQRSIWTTDRGTSTLFELSTNGPSTTTSSTTSTTIAQSTTSSTQGSTTTTTQATTTTTQATTTTTQATTTTTAQGTTTTTQPGSTTTTTIPGTTTTTTTPPPLVPQTAETAVVQTNSGFWRLFRGAGQVAGFFFGNPGDYGFMGDWNCDGIDTPGLYRRSDGYVYLRNTNTQGPADIAFFFGNPGDLPLAGDFNNDGCDTVSIYRPAEGRFFIMNHLGAGDAGLGAADFSFFFGNPGDAPFMGDWNGDGIDTPGLRRNSNGFVYLRHSNSSGPGQIEYFYGDAGDVVFTGDWDGDGDDTLGLYRPSNGNMYLRNTNSTGTADHTVVVGTGMQPFGGNF